MEARSLMIKCLADIESHYEEYYTHGIMFLVRKDLVDNVKLTLTLACLVDGMKESCGKVNDLACWTEDTGVVNDKGFSMSMLSFPSGLNKDEVLNILASMAGIAKGIMDHAGPNNFIQVHVA